MACEEVNILTLAMAKKYTDKSLAGAGAVAGVPCQIQSIKPITGGNRITFLWVDNNNVSHTSTLDVMDGAGGEENKIDSISVNGSPISIDENKNVDITVPSIEGLTKDTDLATVAKSGSYEDLSNKPEIPSIEGLAKTEDIPTKVSELENDSNYLSSIPEEYVTDTELEAKGYLTEHQDISGKVDKVEGKSLISDTEIARLASVDNYDDTALSNRVKTVEDEVPNLATKTYVGEQIANAEHLKREIVTVLPSDEEASDNTIYMLKVESATGNDKYQEYMKIDGTVQMVGDTSVDLTDYAKKTDLHSHTNKTVLDGITSTKVSNWDSAKTHADSAHAPSNAQANVIETVKVNGTALTPSSKAVNVTVPTTVAQLTDSSSYAKKTDIPTTLPANGGNSDTVNNHTVETDVPTDAVFTDTVYDDTEVKGSIEELNSNLGELANTWLKGKTINFLGDSITKGSWYLNGEWQGYMEKPYPAVIANIIGCTSNNFGESGTPIRHNSSNTGFVDRVLNFPSADMNVMFGGVNDLTGGTLGDENSTDINTIYGALKVIAQTFISKNPKSINVFISPLMSNITGGAIKYDEIRRAIKYVANLYGFVFIDASIEAPMMNPNVSELNDIWLNGNLVHPNPEYHEILGKWLAYKLASLESSGSINSNVSNVGCKYFSELRSNGHTYLKITLDNISSASELSIRFILSYGGELVINGNPYYDKSYTLTANTTSIKALLLDNSHWNPKDSDIISNIYIVENAIYVKFNGAVAFTPIVLGCVDIFGISMEWDDAWEGISASTDRELVIKKTPYVCDIGEVSGETIKDALTNLSIVTQNKVYLQANIPFLISSYYKGNTIFALASIDGNGICLFDVTYKDGKYRMVYKPNEYRNIFKASETEL